MKRITLPLAFMTVICLLALPVFSGEVYIPCPLKEARTEMVSPLSDGWWQTPQAWPLEGDRTQVIGGEPTLVCLYRANESVERMKP
jgi:hypothetical protein